MFLDVLKRRNPAFIQAAIALHQSGQIPANSYVLDLDAVMANAQLFQAEAQRLGLKTFAMTKQVGRHSGFCEAIKAGGIDQAVAVDRTCAVACHRAGLQIGHLGHLVQIPKAEAAMAAVTLQPDYWTVFSEEKAAEAAAAAQACGREQALMARVQTDGDTFYRGHEGGFEADKIVEVAERLSSLPSARFAGITTFPALLFDLATKVVKPTPNLSTLQRAAHALRRAGFEQVEINAPGTTSSTVLSALAEAGATQCEPGNGLHGTTPLHAVEDLPEVPAMLYLTEVSHRHAGKAYCFGGGLYVDPIFPDYDVQAIVAASGDPSDQQQASVELPAANAIDYYAMIDDRSLSRVKSGDSVVFGFRGQAFVTRANVVGIQGVSSGAPQMHRIENGFGDPVAWPLS